MHAAAVFVAVLAIASGFFWGPPQQILASAVLAIILVWASIIDIQRHILPNALTFPIIACGLIFSARDGRLVEGLAGALIGYIVLSVCAGLYKRATGREGMGLGDAKLFAGAGAWLGWASLPSVMLQASGLALLSLAISRRRDSEWRQRAIAFGPYIAAGFWLVWLFGPLQAF